MQDECQCQRSHAQTVTTARSGMGTEQLIQSLLTRGPPHSQECTCYAECLEFEIGAVVDDEAEGADLCAGALLHALQLLALTLKVPRDGALANLLDLTDVDCR